LTYTDDELRHGIEALQASLAAAAQKDSLSVAAAIQTIQTSDTDDLFRIFQEAVKQRRGHPPVCHCGEPMAAHNEGSGHTAVPVEEPGDDGDWLRPEYDLKDGVPNEYAFTGKTLSDVRPQGEPIGSGSPGDPRAYFELVARVAAFLGDDDDSAINKLMADKLKDAPKKHLPTPREKALEHALELVLDSGHLCHEPCDHIVCRTVKEVLHDCPMCEDGTTGVVSAEGLKEPCPSCSVPEEERRRGANWTPPANGMPCFFGKDEECTGCGKHIRHHFGGTEYRCEAKPCTCGGTGVLRCTTPNGRTDNHMVYVRGLSTGIWECAFCHRTDESPEWPCPSCKPGEEG